MIRKRPTITQLKLLSDYLQDFCLTRMGRDARSKGQYSSLSSAVTCIRNQLDSPILRSAIQKALYEKGLGEDYVAEKLLKLSNAKTKKFFSDKGFVVSTRVIKDNGTQLRATQTIGKYLGAEVEQVNLTGNINTNHMTELTDDQLRELVRGGSPDSE